jgi:hypothetical protein
MSMHHCLILGAAYGSLLAAKLLQAGHRITMVARPAEVDQIQRAGLEVKIPLRSGRSHILRSLEAPGHLQTVTPDVAPVSGIDMVILAMAEPQFGAPEIVHLMGRIGEARIPCLSIMNIPPPPFLRRILGPSAQSFLDAYHSPQAWDALEDGLVTLCSPDPQATRPASACANVLQVTLPTNFKAAPFADARHTATLRALATSIDDHSWTHLDDEQRERVPVRLVPHTSMYVPLAKWPMLMTGNYRCVTDGGIRSIAEAVHADVEASRKIYRWVEDVCLNMGATRADLVPFEKYAVAASGLERPSAAARALESGGTQIERADRLIQKIALTQGRSFGAVDEIVSQVDQWITRNRGIADTRNDK